MESLGNEPLEYDSMLEMFEILPEETSINISIKELRLWIQSNPSNDQFSPFRFRSFVLQHAFESFDCSIKFI